MVLRRYRCCCSCCRCCYQTLLAPLHASTERGSRSRRRRRRHLGADISFAFGAGLGSGMSRDAGGSCNRLGVLLCADVSLRRLRHPRRRMTDLADLSGDGRGRFGRASTPEGVSVVACRTRGRWETRPRGPELLERRGKSSTSERQWSCTAAAGSPGVLESIVSARLSPGRSECCSQTGGLPRRSGTYRCHMMQNLFLRRVPLVIRDSLEVRAYRPGIPYGDALVRITSSFRTAPFGETKVFSRFSRARSPRYVRKGTVCTYAPPSSKATKVWLERASVSCRGWVCQVSYVPAQPMPAGPSYSLARRQHEQ